MAEQKPMPNPALKRLEKLIGTWEIKGRSLGSQADDISGQVTIDWTLDGFFLELRGEMEAGDFKVQSLEILGYDPAADNFPAMVYSNMEMLPTPYCWDVRDNVVEHWTKGSKYTGKFSEDASELSGGWRADEGVEVNASNTYDAIMIRIR